jgi:hypothetical protein
MADYTITAGAHAQVNGVFTEVQADHSVNEDGTPNEGIILVVCETASKQPTLVSFNHNLVLPPQVHTFAHAGTQFRFDFLTSHYYVLAYLDTHDHPTLWIGGGSDKTGTASEYTTRAYVAPESATKLAVRRSGYLRYGLCYTHGPDVRVREFTFEPVANPGRQGNMFALFEAGEPLSAPAMFPGAFDSLAYSGEYIAAVVAGKTRFISFSGIDLPKDSPGAGPATKVVFADPIASATVLVLRNGDGNLAVETWGSVNGTLIRQGYAHAGTVADIAACSVPKKTNLVATAMINGSGHVEVILWEISTSAQITRKATAVGGPGKRIACCRTATGIATAAISDSQLDVQLWNIAAL